MRFVDLPEPDRKGFLFSVPIVQLMFDFQRLVLFAKRKPMQRFHRQVLEDFLKGNDVGYESIRVPTVGVPIPTLSGSRYAVAGMGLANIYRLPYRIDFFGGSHDYRINLDEEFTRLALEEVDRLVAARPQTGIRIVS